MFLLFILGTRHHSVVACYLKVSSDQHIIALALHNVVDMVT